MLSHQLEGLVLRICSLLALSEHLLLLEPDSFDFELVIMEVNRENQLQVVFAHQDQELDLKYFIRQPIIASIKDQLDPPDFHVLLLPICNPTLTHLFGEFVMALAKLYGQVITAESIYSIHHFTDL